MGNIYDPFRVLCSAMTFRVGRGVDQLFGSETRAKVLGFLADARTPKTGYQISKATGIRPTKVYGELRRLAETDFLEVVEEPRRKLYRMVDEDLRKLLLRRARITSEDEWFSPERVRERREALERASRTPLSLPESTPNRDAVLNPSEYERSPAKDRALRRFAPGRTRRRRARE